VPVKCNTRFQLWRAARRQSRLQEDHAIGFETLYHAIRTYSAPNCFYASTRVCCDCWESRKQKNL